MFFFCFRGSLDLASGLLAEWPLAYEEWQVAIEATIEANRTNRTAEMPHEIVSLLRLGLAMLSLDCDFGQNLWGLTFEALNMDEHGVTFQVISYLWDPLGAYLFRPSKGLSFSSFQGEDPWNSPDVGG